MKSEDKKTWAEKLDFDINKNNDVPQVWTEEKVREFQNQEEYSEAVWDDN